MSTIHDDLIERSVDIHWPDGFDPDHADRFAHNTIVIDAPAENIWAKLIDAAAWPTWYSNASDVAVNDPAGRLAEGATFNWTTFGLKIDSTIAEFVPHARIGWYGTGDQLRAYHTWLLIPATATAPTSLWKRPAWATERSTSPRQTPLEDLRDRLLAGIDAEHKARAVHRRG